MIQNNQDLELQSRRVKNVGSNIVTLKQDPEMQDYLIKRKKPFISTVTLKPNEQIFMPHGYFIPFSDDEKEISLKQIFK